MNRCISSNCSKAAFGQPSLGHVVGSTVSSPRPDNVVMGSVSHFKHGGTVFVCCIRRVFPGGSVLFVTLGSSISAEFSRGRVVPFGSVVGRCCTHSASGGVQDMGGAATLDNKFYNSFTPCNCIISPRGGEGLLISPSATPVIGQVFRLSGRNGDIRRVTEALYRSNILVPETCETVGGNALRADAKFGFPAS